MNYVPLRKLLKFFTFELKTLQNWQTPPPPSRQAQNATLLRCATVEPQKRSEASTMLASGTSRLTASIAGRRVASVPRRHVTNGRVRWARIFGFAFAWRELLRRILFCPSPGFTILINLFIFNSLSLQISQLWWTSWASTFSRTLFITRELAGLKQRETDWVYVVLCRQPIWTSRYAPFRPNYVPTTLATHPTCITTLYIFYLLTLAFCCILSWAKSVCSSVWPKLRILWISTST